MTDTATLQAALSDYFAPWVQALHLQVEPVQPEGAVLLRNPTLINFLDGCALSLPCHARGQGPVGLMLAGAAMADARILALGEAVEAALAD